MSLWYFKLTSQLSPGFVPPIFHMSDGGILGPTSNRTSNRSHLTRDILNQPKKSLHFQLWSWYACPILAPHPRAYFPNVGGLWLGWGMLVCGWETIPNLGVLYFHTGHLRERHRFQHCLFIPWEFTCLLKSLPILKFWCSLKVQREILSLSSNK